MNALIDPPRGNLADAVMAGLGRLGSSQALISYHLREQRIDRLSGHDIQELISKAAAGLTQSGVQAGDRVVIARRYGVQGQMVFLGAMLIGAIPSMLSWPTPKQDPELFWADYAELLHRIRPTVIFTEADFVGQVQAVAPADCLCLSALPEARSSAVTRVQPGTFAFVQYSSGTTGQRKGVALTHDQVLASLAATADGLDLGSADKVASWLPLYHDMGLIAGFLLPLAAGLPLVQLDPFEWVEQPASLLVAMAAEQASFAWQPNFAFQHLIRATPESLVFPLTRLRALISCSEVVRADTLTNFAQRFESWGVQPRHLQAMYAMAETVFAVTMPDLSRAPIIRDGLVSNGAALPGLELRAGGSEPAEILVRGPLVFQGYGDAVPTPGAGGPHQDCEGWFATGDLGQVIDGEVYVTGRIKDVIIFHGVNFYAHDLEAVAGEVPGVRPGRVVAFAHADDDSGSESVVILVEPEITLDGEAALALQRSVSDAVASRLRVAVGRVALVPAGWLVKTTSGKLSRERNRLRWLAQDGVSPRQAQVVTAPPSSGWEDPELGEMVCEVVADTFDVSADSLSARTVAADVAGWDSLGHTVLMIRLGRQWGRPIPESVAARAKDLGDLVRRMKELA